MTPLKLFSVKLSNIYQIQLKEISPLTQFSTHLKIEPNVLPTKELNNQLKIVFMGWINDECM